MAAKGSRSCIAEGRAQSCSRPRGARSQWLVPCAAQLPSTLPVPSQYLLDTPPLPPLPTQVPELRKQAEEDGAAPEWVKSVTKEGGG